MLDLIRNRLVQSILGRMRVMKIQVYSGIKGN